MTMILSAITGSGLKMLGHAISKYFEIKRQKELASLGASDRRIQTVQSGEDKADTWTQATRRVLAFMLIGTWCFVIIWHVVVNPEAVYNVPMEKSNSFFSSIFFDTIDKSPVSLSGGSLLWGFMDFVGLICGFYFTKMGR